MVKRDSKWNMYALIMGLYAAFVTTSGVAQKNLPSEEKNRKNSISLYTGYHSNKSQDLVISEKIYKGAATNVFGLNYTRLVKKGLYMATFESDKISISPSELINTPAFGQREKSQVEQLNLELAYVREIGKSNTFNWYLGGLLKAKYYEANITFGLGDEKSYLYENTLNALVMTSYSLNGKSRIAAKLYLPVLAFTARPEYAIVDNLDIQGAEGLDYMYSKGELGSWNQYKGVNLSLGYERHFSTTFSGFMNYHLAYWQVSIPEKMNVLKNNIDLGLTVRF